MIVRFLVNTAVCAVALWGTTLLITWFTGSPGNGMWLEPWGGLTAIPDNAWGRLAAQTLNYLGAAVLFGLVRALLGPLLRTIGLPFIVLTLGLFWWVINAALLHTTAWVGGLLGFGIHVDGFWWGVGAALILSILTGLLKLLIAPSQRRG